MSNKATRIKKVIKKPDPLYNSLIGSIVCTVGLTTGKTERQCRTLFNILRKNKQVLPDTVIGIAEYVWTIFGNDDLVPVRSKYVLVFDSLEVRQPMVSFVNDEGNIMPLNPKGFTDTNILSLANEGRDYIDAEFLYNEDGSKIEDEEDKCSIQDC